MIKKKLFGIGIAGVLVAGLASSLVGFPVFADGPVNISIVEMVDDGAGGYKNWEDITGAMPGMTYSAIPRIINDGSVAVPIWVCLSESVMNGAGETVILPSNTFGIIINPNWSLNETVGNASDPASGNCYKYNKQIEPGEFTEPVFTEVTLNPNLGNEHQNATFSLHIDAYASDEEPMPEPEPEGEPGSPDTGLMARSGVNASIIVPYMLGGAALVVLLIHLGRGLLKKHK